MINGMTPDEYQRLKDVHARLEQIGGVKGVTHQSWDDVYVADIDVERLFALSGQYRFLPMSRL